MDECLLGDASAAVYLATRWAYGHADWPNGRPDGPSRAPPIRARVFVDAQGVTKASVAHCPQNSLIPTAINSRISPPVCCMCRRVRDRVWVRGAWDKALWAAIAPWKSCRWYPACTRPRKLGSGSRVYAMAPQLTGESQLVTNKMVDRCVLRRSCQWAGNVPVDFWRESSRTMALLCIVSLLCTVEPSMESWSARSALRHALSAHVPVWESIIYSFFKVTDSMHI